MIDVTVNVFPFLLYRTKLIAACLFSNSLTALLPLFSLLPLLGLGLGFLPLFCRFFSLPGEGEWTDTKNGCKEATF